MMNNHHHHLLGATSSIPAKGWNSWDAYKQNLNESTALAIAANMKRLLLPHGYDTLVIDGGWSDAYNHDVCPPGPPCIDANGRMVPNIVKWPSSAGGKGLKPFIDKVHAMGLKVGMHTLQSTLSKAALAAKSPVLGGGGKTVNDIVGKVCSWQKWGYGVQMSLPASQLWLDSVYAQYSAWGLDLIKNDCVFAINWIDGDGGEELIKGAKSAIAKTEHCEDGHCIYSLSPGQTATIEMGRNISRTADMYRITGDWHDCNDGRWGARCGNLSKHFSQAHAFESIIGSPSFPDLDILSPYNSVADPLDLAFRFQMTFWCICRSPLFIGRDLADPTLTAVDLALLTNADVLAVNERSKNNRQISRKGDDLIVWAADVPAASDRGESASQSRYVALFNHGKVSSVVSVTLEELNLPHDGASCIVKNLWTGKAEPTMLKGNVLGLTLDAVTGNWLGLLECTPTKNIF